MTTTSPGAPDPTQPLQPDRSLGELLGELTQDFGALVTTQVDLAKVEIKEEVRHVARSAQMLAGGAIAGYFAALLALSALAWGLSDAFDSAWAGFLVTAVLVGIVAAVLLAVGRKRMRDVQPLPQTTTTVQEDVQWARRQAS